MGIVTSNSWHCCSTCTASATTVIVCTGHVEMVMRQSDPQTAICFIRQKLANVQRDKLILVHQTAQKTKRQ